MTSVCVLGGSGTIGKALASFLRSDPSIEVISLSISDYFSSIRNFDVIYYCIGMTSDFRSLPFRTVEAHIEILSKVLQKNRFGVLVYLSSARVYKDSSDTNEELPLLINPNDSDSIYNISKLAGESLCLLADYKRTRVARISNVVSRSHNQNSFLGFLSNSLKTGSFVLSSSLKSEKDYVDIDQVTFCLREIGFRSVQKIYNIGSGFNIKTEEIIDALAHHFPTTLKVHSNEAEMHNFPIIDISRISSEFGVRPKDKTDIIQLILASMNGFDYGN